MILTKANNCPAKKQISGHSRMELNKKVSIFEKYAYKKQPASDDVEAGCFLRFRVMPGMTIN